MAREIIVRQGLFTGPIVKIGKWKPDKVIWICACVEIRKGNNPYYENIWIKFTEKSLMEIFKLGSNELTASILYRELIGSIVTFDGFINHKNDAHFCHNPENFRILREET